MQAGLAIAAARARRTSAHGGAVWRDACSGFIPRCRPRLFRASSGAVPLSTTAWTNSQTSALRRLILEARATSAHVSGCCFHRGLQLYRLNQSTIRIPISMAAALMSATSATPGSLKPLLPEDCPLPRPVLGYFGVIDERLDYPLIARLAKLFRMRRCDGRADCQDRPGRAALPDEHSIGWVSAIIRICRGSLKVSMFA